MDKQLRMSNSQEQQQTASAVKEGQEAIIASQGNTAEDKDTEPSAEEVNELIEQLEFSSDDASFSKNLPIYEAMGAAIQNWPIEKQKNLFLSIIERYGLDDFVESGGLNLYVQMRDWPMTETLSFLKEVKASGISNGNAQELKKIAEIALSNWSYEDINELIRNRESRTLIGFDQTGFNYDVDSTKFIQNLLKFRTSPLDEGFKEWLLEILGPLELVGVMDSQLDLFESNPDLLFPELAERFMSQETKPGYFSIGSGNIERLRNLIREHIVSIPKEKQQEYHSSAASVFKIKQVIVDERSLQEEREKWKSLVSQWDQEYLQKIASMLLSKPNMPVVAFSTSGSNEIQSFERNILWLIDKVDLITDEDLIEKVVDLGVTFGIAQKSIFEVSRKKIAETPEVQEIIKKTLGRNIAKFLRRSDWENIKKLIQEFPVGELVDFQDSLPLGIASFIDNFGITTTDDLIIFVNKIGGYKGHDFIAFLSSENSTTSVALRPKDLESLEVSPLKNDLIALELMKRRGLELDCDGKDEDYYQTLHELLKNEHPDWRDEQNILNPFQSGVEVFGYEKMFSYVGQDVVFTNHEALHAFEDIVDLYEASGLSPDQFYGNILHQVMMSTNEYTEGTAYHALNSVAQTIDKDFERILQAAQELEDIEQLQDLAAEYNSPEDIFASWKKLHRYSDLEHLLSRKVLIRELRELKTAGKEALYHYIKTLAFHPDSKVDVNAIVNFWRHPEDFLAMRASHTPYRVHDRKKPSNYVHIPNLDLTAVELRDALVEGDLDRLQVFSPLEVSYEAIVSGRQSLHEAVRDAIGVRSQGIEGRAQNPGKLFSELNNFFKSKNLNFLEYFKTGQLPEASDFTTEIEQLVYNPSFGMVQPEIETRTFVAKITYKSDPEGVLAGDDTANCMPFGDGKNTLYTFNPNTAQLLVRMVKPDGKERTIAQSVLTKDIDIQSAVSNVIKQLEQEKTHLDELLPSTVLEASPTYLACDNIEVAHNYSNENYRRLLEAIFRDFFQQYMELYAESQGLEPTKVPIGQGFTDALTQLPEEPNTYAPQAPVSYSDKTGENVYMLDLSSQGGMDLIVDREVRKPEASSEQGDALAYTRGLSFLTFEDALQVAYLEGKAYSDNESLMEFLWNMENGLIAKDINNQAKGRPNLSLKYRDVNGRMRGYLLAWEGKISSEPVSSSDNRFNDSRCVYIADVATDREHRLAGGRLVRKFVELYRQNYLDKKDSIPIYAEARESTSYRYIKRYLDKLAVESGVEFELVELPPYQVGEDTMHPVVINPI